MNIFQQVFASIDPKVNVLVKSSENSNGNATTTKGKANNNASNIHCALTSKNSKKEKLSGNKDQIKTNKLSQINTSQSITLRNSRHEQSATQKSNTDMKNIQNKGFISTESSQNKVQLNDPISQKQISQTVDQLSSTDSQQSCQMSSKSVISSDLSQTTLKFKPNDSELTPKETNIQSNTNQIENSANQATDSNSNIFCIGKIQKKAVSSSNSKLQIQQNDRDKDLFDESEILSHIKELETKYENACKQLDNLAILFSKTQIQNDHFAAQNMRLDTEIEKLQNASKDTNRRIIEMKDNFNDKMKEKNESWAFKVNELQMQLDVLRESTKDSE